MPTPDNLDLFHRTIRELETQNPGDWDELSRLLHQVGNRESAYLKRDQSKLPGAGVVLITFDYGVDGVSVEISKYARSLEDIYGKEEAFSIHLIGGAFYPPASSVLNDRWYRHIMQGINGWNKWDGGRWFKALYRQKMPPGRGGESAHIAKEMHTQAISIADRLGQYVLENNIALLIPVNIASNPGNFALVLGVALVSEILGVLVLNINHDFYWEEGHPPSERRPDEEPGIRDHFFMNSDNKSFFTLFQSLYPYDGKNWLQANINQLQTKRLIEQFHFNSEKVFEISTYVGDAFFEKYDQNAVKHARLRMAHILSDGAALPCPLPIGDHLSEIDQWMRDQSPRIIGARDGLSMDPLSDDLIVLLQPTRVINRKRIGRNLELIAALIRNSALGMEFNKNPKRKLVLHVTGPVPREHKTDLMQVLQSYNDMLHSMAPESSDRIFLAFSVGHQQHPSFTKNQFDPLAVEEIFRMANAVVFPSMSEGRGLPIIEASAAGIPIICSRYRPEKVFAEVVGEHLPQELQIRYTLFPEGDFRQEFLEEVARILLHPEKSQNNIVQNQNAVLARYSRKSMKKNLANLIAKLVD